MAWLRASLLALAALILLPAPAGSAASAQPPQTNWLKMIAATPEGGVRQGNPNARIKLVEYGSRSCPVCGRFAEEGVGPLRSKYVATGKVSYEYRELWIHPQDPALSLVGYCVPTASFFRVLDGMYAEQQAFNARATPQLANQIQALPRSQQPAAWARGLGYVEFLRRHGVNPAPISPCLANLALLNKLVARVQTAADNGVDSTPTFFLNGRLLNAYTWAQLEPELQANGA